jgi:N-acetylglucosaminyldiphosphoundecaprenol N-acetyl-beta-D-mannosaminyltransferase
MQSLGNRLRILDVWVDPVDMEMAVQKVHSFIEKGARPHVIYAINPEKNFSVPRSPSLHRSFREADLLIPDGIGVVAAARMIYGARISRVPGVELSARICALAAEKGYRIFIYGGKEEVSLRAVEVLRDRFPGIQILGRANGYLQDDQMEGLIDQINRSKAEILFVALGSPRQELWISEYKDSLKTVRLCQGIGGTLDTIAGTVQRAPEFWRRWNVEWLYRLLAEPKRIKRQSVLPVFATQVLFLKLRNMMNFSA